MYIHEINGWPRLHWDAERLAAPLASVRHRQGKLIGRMESMGLNSTVCTSAVHPPPKRGNFRGRTAASGGRASPQHLPPYSGRTPRRL